ncbi:MAG: metallophosphoesterase [Firmicutes bacterium]|nr:metallophosphoesterase [Bacillota bacterium]
MIPVKMILFMIPATLVLLVANYYVGKKIKYIFTANNITPNPCAFWIIYEMFALLFTLNKIVTVNKDTFLGYFIKYGGGISFGIIMYFFIFFLISDILRCIAKRYKINIPILKKAYGNGIAIVILSVLIVIYGFVNARYITVKEYNIDINKYLPYPNLDIAMISDTHIGTVLEKDGIDELVSMTNELNADIVCLCGDIFDESTSDELIEYSAKALGSINSKNGIFYVFVNHDYSGHIGFEDILEKNHIKILNNDYIYNDGYYIAGRVDPTVVDPPLRCPLSDFTENIDFSKPVILLDHQPIDTEEAKKAGVDLQLSGHTHRGQIFPGEIITYFMNDKRYGLYNDGNYNIIVSSGTSVWGVPLRTSGQNELLHIHLNFNKQGRY